MARQTHSKPAHRSQISVRPTADAEAADAADVLRVARGPSLELTRFCGHLGSVALEERGFVLHRGAIAEGRVPALPIVPDLDEREQLATRVAPTLEHPVAKQLLRQRGK